jgi:hypothetical protein
VFSKLIMVALMSLLLACDNPSFTGPDPTPAPPEEPTEETEPVVKGPRVDFNNLWGYSYFPMPEMPEDQQRRDLRFAQRRGYTFARICAETVQWGGVFPSGSHLVEAEQKLKRTLDIAAEENMYVLVVAICTIRDAGTEYRRVEWVKHVAAQLKGRRNVFAEAVNEPWHPRSKVSPKALDGYIQILKRAGIATGADQGLGFPSGRYQYTLSSRSEFPSFHPWRNPDPTRSQIRQIVGQNNGWALLSETTAWGSEADVAFFGGLVTSSKNQIQHYMDNCRAVSGCFMVAHTMEGLMGEELTWLPLIQ